MDENHLSFTAIQGQVMFTKWKWVFGDIGHLSEVTL